MASVTNFEGTISVVTSADVRCDGKLLMKEIRVKSS